MIFTRSPLGGVKLKVQEKKARPSNKVYGTRDRRTTLVSALCARKETAANKLGASPQTYEWLSGSKHWMHRHAP